MAQLGARFHGMEEVKGSNPFRSTKTFSILSVLGPQKSSPSDFKLHLMPLLSGYKLNQLLRKCPQIFLGVFVLKGL